MTEPIKPNKNPGCEQRVVVLGDSRAQTICEQRGKTILQQRWNPTGGAAKWEQGRAGASEKPAELLPQIPTPNTNLSIPGRVMGSSAQKCLSLLLQGHPQRCPCSISVPSGAPRAGSAQE